MLAVCRYLSISEKKSEDRFVVILFSFRECRGWGGMSKTRIRCSVFKGLGCCCYSRYHASNSL